MHKRFMDSISLGLGLESRTQRAFRRLSGLLFLATSLALPGQSFAQAAKPAGETKEQAPANPPASPPVQPAPVPAPAAAPQASPAPADATAKPEIRVAPAPPESKREEGQSRPVNTGIGEHPSEVYAEDWWSKARPTFDIHGYFRVRSELFHQFALGRKDAGGGLWAQPADNDYVDTLNNHHQVKLCGDSPTNPEPCDQNTQAGANMRFRLSPELHVSDNVRVMAQIDLLDNVALGSTPQSYANLPGRSSAGSGGTSSGYSVTQAGSSNSLLSTTQWSPVSAVNSTRDAISVKRVWGEYMTPLGVLRFGRMPNQWGLGMVYNAGDGYDSDWQSTVDRLMFVTGIKKYDLYFAGAIDFINEGAQSAQVTEQEGQPYDLAQSDDVDSYMFSIVRRRSPELQRLDLANGDFVLNGGARLDYRRQSLANDTVEQDKSAALGQASEDVGQGYVRRGAEILAPDVWVQFLYDKFRFEAEAALIYGTIENTEASPGASNYRDPTSSQRGFKLGQFGIATQTEYRAVEDRLRLQLGFGYATGDQDTDSLDPSPTGLEPQRTLDRTFSQFRFHPDYRVDMILFRHILERVQGAYYFRPSVDYDFMREKNGQRIGGGAAVIWSRASQLIQTPGHAPDLGIELNFQLYYQAKDGALNDNPDKMGGFYTALQYGVLFPLGGLGYLPGEIERYRTNTGGAELDTSTAQTLRWYLGVLF